MYTHTVPSSPPPSCCLEAGRLPEVPGSGPQSPPPAGSTFNTVVLQHFSLLQQFVCDLQGQNWFLLQFASCSVHSFYNKSCCNIIISSNAAGQGKQTSIAIWSLICSALRWWPMKTRHVSAVQCRKVQYSIMKYSAVEWCAMHLGAVQFSAFNWSAVQYKLVHWSAVYFPLLQWIYWWSYKVI